MERKSRNIWLSLLPVVIVLGIQLLLGIMLAEAAYVYAIANFHGDGMNDLLKQYIEVCTNTSVLMVLQTLYAVIAVALFIPWYQKTFCGKEPAVTWKQLTKRPGVFAAGAVLFVVGMQYLSVYLINIMAIIQPRWLADYEEQIGQLDVSGGGMVIMVLYVVILGPLCEELAFRGLTLGYAKRALPFWAANVIQALLFAAVHMNIIQSTYTFFLGLLLGYLCHRSGKLAYTIVLHMLFNLFGTFLNQLVVMEADSPVRFFIGLMIGMVGTYLGFGLLRKSMEKGVNHPVDVSDMDNTV